MFDRAIVQAAMEAADKHGIDPASLLALIEVETGGEAFERDGRTPRLLYERHVAWREAGKKSKAMLARFVAAGLAIPRWNRATQYRDERTSAMRLALLEKAKAIDVEVALRSCSWGLGQTMGFLAEELGFSSAESMVAYQTGSISGQINCLVAELRRRGLVKSLNSHDWQRTARLYNGAGYRQNRYDERLRDAYVRWSRKLAKPSEHYPEQSLERDEIEEIQRKLRSLGYHEVGIPDGKWGPRTVGAISAFQAHEGLTVNGHYDDATKSALASASPRFSPVKTPAEREIATADDLREAGSDTIKHSDRLSRLAGAKTTAGGLLVGGGIADKLGLLDQANDTLDKVDQAQSVVSRIKDLLHPIIGGNETLIFGAVLLFAGLAVGFLANRIIANRLKDHATGEHAGPTPDDDS